MSMTPKQAVERHLKAAKEVRKLQADLNELTTLMRGRHTSTEEEKKILLSMGKNLSQAKNHLDELYHSVASDSDVKKYGHVYYKDRGE